MAPTMLSQRNSSQQVRQQVLEPKSRGTARKIPIDVFRGLKIAAEYAKTGTNTRP